MKNSDFLPKPELTHFQRRRDGKHSESLQELISYIDKCSKWKVFSNNIGYLDKDEKTIIVYKIKGQRCYMQFSQTPDNRFYFSFLEAQSLMFANRLIILSTNSDGNIDLVTPHRYLNYAFSKGISFDSCKKYNIFSRIGASKAKIQPITSNTPEEKPKSGFRAKMEKFRQVKNIKCSYPKGMFPQLEYVKFPQGHGLPDFGFISVNDESNYDMPEVPTIVPISLKYLVQVNPSPGLNRI